MTDCVAVSNLLQPESQDKSALFPLISDVKDMMDSFASVSVSAINRESNVLAHKLSAYARAHGDSLLIANVPDVLRQFVSNDCNLNPDNL